MEKNNSKKKTSRFSHWFFDLDNTLYCANSGIFDQIHKKMGEFISSNQNVSLKEAKFLQKKYFEFELISPTTKKLEDAQGKKFLIFCLFFIHFGWNSNMSLKSADFTVQIPLQNSTFLKMRNYLPCASSNFFVVGDVNSNSKYLFCKNKGELSIIFREKHPKPNLNRSARVVKKSWWLFKGYPLIFLVVVQPHF